MKTLLILILLLPNLLFLILFAPSTYRFLREEYAGQFPFDKPVWYYRLRRLWQRHRADLEGLGFVVLIFFCYWLFSFAL